MRIALCDADRVSLKNTKNLLYEYANKHRIDFLIDEFYSGVTLLSSNERYEIVFIEYNIEGLNGLETSKILRQKNRNSAIIFFSSYVGFILESFKVSPFRFLVKPISSNLLFSTMDEFFEKQGNDYPLWIKDQDNNTFCLNTADIFYLEADNKHCFVNLKNNQYSCRKTMAKVFEVLPKTHFYKINRAYVVNLNCISVYNNDYIILTNGCKLHISRSYLQSFKKEYRNFLNPKIP